MYEDVFGLSSCSDRGVGKVKLLTAFVFSVVTEITMHRQGILQNNIYYSEKKKKVLVDIFLSSK